MHREIKTTTTTIKPKKNMKVTVTEFLEKTIELTDDEIEFVIDERGRVMVPELREVLFAEHLASSEIVYPARKLARKVLESNADEKTKKLASNLLKWSEGWERADWEFDY